MTDCDNCGAPVNVVATRWRCTRCGHKLNCCNGEPLPQTLPADPK